MKKNNYFSVYNLFVSVESKEILKGVNFQISQGEIHAIIGPNGSGKSTFANVLLGHPKYEVTKGEILFKGKNIFELTPDERAGLGFFLAFQYPFEIQGVALSQFLWRAILSLKNKRKNGFPESFLEFKKELKRNIELLGLKEEFIDRDVNLGFSGGEKKRAEIVQMLTLKPEFAILDEPDSGLDIDSIKIVSRAINLLRGPSFSALLITHYQRILNYVKPDVVHVMANGKIVETGDINLVEKVEREGYARYTHILTKGE